MSRAGARRSFCRIYAGSETSGTLGSSTITWAERSTAWGGFIQKFMSLRNYGAGEANRGTREIEFPPRSEIVERDGLAVEAGPEAGTRWRVTDVDHSDPRRTWVQVEPYTGDFA